MNLDQARQFNEHKATAFAAIMDRENRLPKELVPALAEAGLLGLRTPKAHTKEFPVERFFRDARVLTLFEGTSEIQKLVIAKNLLKKR